MAGNGMTRREKEWGVAALLSGALYFLLAHEIFYTSTAFTFLLVLPVACVLLWRAMTYCQVAQGGFLCVVFWLGVFTVWFPIEILGLFWGAAALLTFPLGFILFFWNLFQYQAFNPGNEGDSLPTGFWANIALWYSGFLVICYLLAIFWSFATFQISSDLPSHATEKSAEEAQYRRHYAEAASCVWGTNCSGAGGRIAGSDWNSAMSMHNAWTDKTISTNAISIDGDGKYRITSCSGNLQTITNANATAGDMVFLTIDGSGCTSLTVEDTTGNIELSTNTDVTLTSTEQFLLLIYDGTNYVNALSSIVASQVSSTADDGRVCFTPSTSGESLWCIGTNHDSGGDDDDPVEIRQSTTAGSSVAATVTPPDAAGVRLWSSYIVDTIFLPVGWCNDGTTASAAIAEHGQRDYRDFDPTTAEDILCAWEVPSDLFEAIANEVKVRAIYVITNSTTPAANEGVSWGIAGCSIGSGDTLDCTEGTEINSETADLSAHAQWDEVRDAFVAVTITDLAAGETVRFSVQRDVADADDDYGQDVGFIGLEIKYYRQIGSIAY